MVNPQERNGVQVSLQLRTRCNPADGLIERLAQLEVSGNHLLRVRTPDGQE